MESEEKLRDANAYKRELTETLKGLEKKFEGVLRRNSKLPPSQQLTPAELIIDDRIEEDLASFLEKEMESVKFKLAWTVEKSRLQHEKLNNYYIKSIDHHLIKVCGVNNQDIYAETFRLQNLGSDFDNLKDLVSQKLEEQEAKGR